MDKRLSHAYMLIGPGGAGRENALKELCAAMLCTEENAPCRACRNCRKVFSGSHPDVIAVERQPDDNGRLPQTFPIKQMRDIVADAYIIPNEAARKVYVIREADRIKTDAQKVLLKVLEEPPVHAGFILCAAAADSLLPTIRSRCVRVDDFDRSPEPAELSEFAGGYIEVAAGGNAAEMTRFCMLHAKASREEAEQFLEETIDAMADILCGRRKNPGLSAAQILRTADLFDHAQEALRRNISPKQIFGLLAVQMDLGETDDRRNRNS